MCGFGGPKVVKRDVKAEQAEAERLATEKANAEIAGRRSKRRSQSLIANPGGAAGLGGSVISQVQNRTTLG